MAARFPKRNRRSDRDHPGARGRTLGRCEDGAAILEFALVLPILFALLAGAFEFGRALLVRHAMVEAVRGGARLLARIPDPDCTLTCPPGVVRAVALTRNAIAEAGLPAGTGLDVSPRWDPATDTVAMRADVRLDAGLLRPLGLGPVLLLRVTHTERRVGE